MLDLLTIAEPVEQPDVISLAVELAFEEADAGEPDWLRRRFRRPKYVTIPGQRT
jgi:hypothetical protein